MHYSYLELPKPSFFCRVRIKSEVDLQTKVLVVTLNLKP